MLALENTKQNVMLYLSFERPCSQINATQRPNACVFLMTLCVKHFFGWHNRVTYILKFQKSAILTRS